MGPPGKPMRLTLTAFAFVPIAERRSRRPSTALDHVQLIVEVMEYVAFSAGSRLASELPERGG